MLSYIAFHQHILFFLWVRADGCNYGCVSLLYFAWGESFEFAIQIVDWVCDHESLVETCGQFNWPWLDYAQDIVLSLLVDFEIDVLLDGHHILSEILTIKG